MSEDGCTELTCPYHGEANRELRGETHPEPVFHDDEPGTICPDCGRTEGTFACKIRHIQVNTGWAKSAND